jgi:HSP20 family protein
MAEKGKEKSEATASRALASWDPFAEMESFFQGWRPIEPRLRRFFEERPAAFAPALDVHESEAEYVISAEVPGVAKGDLTVEVDQGILTIRGEKKSQREEKKERSRWVERTYGSFTRSLRLPADALADKIDASFKDGVLTIKIQRAEQRKPKAIAVKT